MSTVRAVTDVAGFCCALWNSRQRTSTARQVTAWRAVLVLDSTNYRVPGRGQAPETFTEQLAPTPRLSFFAALRMTGSMLALAPDNSWNPRENGRNLLAVIVNFDIPWTLALMSGDTYEKYSLR
jgi:hypothetical protein